MRRLRALRREDGFTLAPVMIGMAVIALLSVAALATVQGDFAVARGDQDRKRAYDAAEAGVAWYGFQLARNPSYWTQCVPSDPNAPVNQMWNGTGTDTRTRYRTMPDTPDAKYAIELIPATGKTSCDTANPGASMLQNKTLRIRSTGVVNGRRRAIVATFKRRSFLDYLYYSKYETNDPVTYDHSFVVSDYNGGAMNAYDATLDDQATQKCAQFYRDGRGNQVLTLSYTGKDNKPHTATMGCQEIQWTTGDVVNGPLHTQDQLLVCGTPTFGRTAADAIEVLDGNGGGVRSTGCTGSPSFLGTKISPSPSVDPPPSNSALASLATSAYTFTGATTILLQGSQMQVTNNGSTRTLAMPANGVLAVKNGTCGVPYSFYETYAEPAGCGIVSISGSYSSSLTISSDDDILITGNVTRASGSTALLGLIASNFVRIRHRVAMANGVCDTTSAEQDPAADLTVTAAILALQHSFIVDNYGCGTPRGKLIVTGTIAQLFRGPVGTTQSNGSTTGYIKNYGYDDRLAFDSPPNFLDPVQASWRLFRSEEYTPAR